ncbi:MAG: OmpH family outer membrane protein [Bacteroidales bacterium]|nr:OmpH family outer membrane protein [Bacteroidales bacterium]
MDNSKFSKIALIVSIVALAASVTVLIISLTGNKSANGGNNADSKGIVMDSLGNISIAYVNLDSLLLEYKYSIKLNEDLLTEQAKAKANLEGRIRSFEKKYNDFMEKMKLGSFISQASMESQQNDLMQEQSNLEQLDAQLTEELMMKQTEMNEELYDTVMNFIKGNYAENYTLILGNAAGSNILYAAPGMNITRDVIDQLNERYAKTKDNN